MSLEIEKRLSLEDKLKNAKEENKKSEKNFFNSLLNICLLNGLVDWSDKDPKKEFADIGRLVIIYTETEVNLEEEA